MWKGSGLTSVTWSWTVNFSVVSRLCDLVCFLVYREAVPLSRVADSVAVVRGASAFDGIGLN